MAEAHASTIDSSRMPIVASEVCSASTAAALPKFRLSIAQNEKILQPFRSDGLLAFSRKADCQSYGAEDQKKRRQSGSGPSGFDRLFIVHRIDEAEKQHDGVFKRQSRPTEPQDFARRTIHYPSPATDTITAVERGGIDLSQTVDQGPVRPEP